MKKRKQSLRNDVWNLPLGILMGASNVIPGVSGGTVALITGIYQRLVTAISHFDLQLISLLRRRQWNQAREHIDFWFLASLGVGIGLGVVAMSKLSDRLLSTLWTRELTFAAFFGMIFASAVLVALMVKVRSVYDLAAKLSLGVAGAALAYWLTTQQNTFGTSWVPSYPYLFCCGAITICAMILPGISGAMLLLMMGVYQHLTKIPGNLQHGTDVGQSLTTLVVFGLGCAAGLLGFSKILRWLLAQHYAPTMAVLSGFMFGSLPLIWPFQKRIFPAMEVGKHDPTRPVLPTELNLQVALALGIALVALIFVIAVDRYTRGHSRQPISESE